MLLQKRDDNVDKPIGYWSKILNHRKQILKTVHRECIAVVWATLFLCLYLDGTKFMVRPDRHALDWICNLRNVTGKYARSHLCLMVYGFEMVHCAALELQIGDSLSQFPTKWTDESDIEDEIPMIAISMVAVNTLRKVLDNTRERTDIEKNN